MKKVHGCCAVLVALLAGCGGGGSAGVLGRTDRETGGLTPRPPASPAFDSAATASPLPASPLPVSTLPVTASAAANELEWISFQDPASPSGFDCDLVNGADFGAVVRPDGQLAIIDLPGDTGDGVISVALAADGTLFLGAEPLGVISFALDADGASRLWALQTDGSALSWEAQSVALFPADFTDVPCAACPYVENPATVMGCP